MQLTYSLGVPKNKNNVAPFLLSLFYQCINDECSKVNAEQITYVIQAGI